MSAAERFARLPTAAKLLLILTIAILPIGIALTWIAESGIRQANSALRGRTDDQARSAVSGMESLIARDALALRIAANGALLQSGGNACQQAERSLSIAPGVSQHFVLEDPSGTLICSANGFVAPVQMLVAPGAIRVRVDDQARSLLVAVGVAGGIAITSITDVELKRAALEHTDQLASLIIRDGQRELSVITPSDEPGQDLTRSIRQWPLANGQLLARTGSKLAAIGTLDRLVLLLPVLMWVMAALITWLLVTRLLIRPLKRLQRSVTLYQPGDESLNLPSRLGPSTEIQDLRDAFGRAVSRVDESERELLGAIEGQRRLVREVHHRVKNNLQVVASLLSIHGRSTASAEAGEAYAAIGRRVAALSIVHRNHFADLEENRGIALRPLVAELAAELRAGAPDTARGLAIDIDVESVNTTQDVAVAVAFLVTEIIEFAMLNRPQDPVEISIRRTSDLTARLTLASPVLVPEEADQQHKVQFERIVGGLAKQLRSTLDRKLGRYSIDMPIFPPL